MTDFKDYIPEAHDDIVRNYQGYYPEIFTTQRSDYAFGVAIADTLTEFGYTRVRTDPAYIRAGRTCTDSYWVNKPENVTVKVTEYRKDDKSWYYLKFDGVGRKAHTVWCELKEIEAEVIEHDL